MYTASSKEIYTDFQRSGIHTRFEYYGGHTLIFHATNNERRKKKHAKTSFEFEIAGGGLICN